MRLESPLAWAKHRLHPGSHKTREVGRLNLSVSPGFSSEEVKIGGSFKINPCVSPTRTDSSAISRLGQVPPSHGAAMRVQ